MKQRSAFTVLELVVATAILGAALGAIAYLVGTTHVSMDRDREWTLVGQTLDAAMESLAAEGYGRLKIRSAQPVPVPEEVDRVVPELRITATVVQTQAHLKTITLVASWRPRPERPCRTAELKTQIAPRHTKEATR